MNILQGGVRWYANCGFLHRRSCPRGQESSPKSATTTHKCPLQGILKENNTKTFKQ